MHPPLPLQDSLNHLPFEHRCSSSMEVKLCGGYPKAAIRRAPFSWKETTKRLRHDSLGVPSPTINPACESKGERNFSLGDYKSYLIAEEEKPDAKAQLPKHRRLQKHASPRFEELFVFPQTVRGPRFLLELREISSFKSFVSLLGKRNSRIRLTAKRVQD